MSATILGNTTNYVTSQAVTGDQVRRQGRARKYRLQDAAARLLPDWRVAWCLNRAVSAPGHSRGVEVWLDHEQLRAHYSGLATCGSVWTCPICASKISERRRQDLERAVAGSGLTPILVTVTLQHDRQDRLTDLIEDLNNTLRVLKSGGWWTRFKAEWQVKAYVSSLEVTWSPVNAWHPHRHWLLFVDRTEDELDRDQLKAELTARYTGLLTKVGRYASDHYGIDVVIGQPAAVAVGRYVTKWGLASEVTKAIVKNGQAGGLSPWQLLELYDQGDLQAGALFAEYALATQGRRQLVWSQGGRKALGIGEEVSDEDLAAEEVKVDQVEELVIRLDPVEWKLVLKAAGRCKVLDLAEQGGTTAVHGYIDQLWLDHRRG